MHRVTASSSFRETIHVAGTFHLDCHFQFLGVPQANGSIGMTRQDMSSILATPTEICHVTFFLNQHSSIHDSSVIVELTNGMLDLFFMKIDSL